MSYSVLMSVYKNDNIDDFKNAVDSVLNQSLKPDQIVIVIDGPIPNKLRDALNEYSQANKSIDIVPLSENVGLGRALSIGLPYCRNELVARMDSDDFSLSHRFELQARYLEQHSDVDVLGGQIMEYDSTMENPIAERRVPLEMPDIKKTMKSRNGMNHVTVMYKKSAVIESGNYQDCPYFEDYYLWCRMIKNGYVFHNLDEVLVNVRTGSEMYQRRGGKKYNKAIVDFQKKALKIEFINRFQFIANLCVRLSVANMPNALRGYLYKTKLRTASSKANNANKGNGK